MNWKTKATIMRSCAVMPYGDRIYKIGQKRLGRLAAKPMSRLPVQAEMAKWILESGRTINGRHWFEVGTGHVPIIPIGFFLCGAGQLTTVDIHHRIDWDLTRRTLQWMAVHEQELRTLYRGLVNENIFNERFDLLTSFAHEPKRFINQANIDYQAPMDASRTNLPYHSVDFHFSMTTLEHISPQIIRDIFIEAKRIIKTNGAAIHFIDLSDHFQHQDSSITRINFLRYGEREWQRIAGNEFAYCNRIRASEYLRMFEELFYTVNRYQSNVDQESMAGLLKGEFALDSGFLSYTPMDNCTITLKVLLTPLH